MLFELSDSATFNLLIDFVFYHGTLPFLSECSSIYVARTDTVCVVFSHLVQYQAILSRQQAQYFGTQLLCYR